MCWKVAVAMGVSLVPKEVNLFKLIAVCWKAILPPFIYVGVLFETMFLLKFDEPFSGITF